MSNKLNIEIIIPENLNDITLGDYQEYITLEEPTEQDIFRIFYNLTPSDMYKIKSSDASYMVNQVVSILQHKPMHLNRFILGGVEFGMIPDLEEISYGENKDIVAYISEPRNWHRMMAVLYRPITKKTGDKYKIEEYDGSNKYSNVMKEAPLGVALGVMVFFWNLINALLSVTPNYIKKQTEKAMKMIDSSQIPESYLEENGEAIKSSLNYLKGTLEGLMRYQDYHSNNA